MGATPPAVELQRALGPVVLVRPEVQEETWREQRKRIA